MSVQRPPYRHHSLCEERDDSDLVATRVSWDGTGDCRLTPAECYRARFVATDAELEAMSPCRCGGKP